MGTHNIHFHHRIRRFRKILLNVCFLKLSEEVPKDPTTSSNQLRLTSNRCSDSLVLLYPRESSCGVVYVNCLQNTTAVCCVFVKDARLLLTPNLETDIQKEREIIFFRYLHFSF